MHSASALVVAGKLVKGMVATQLRRLATRININAIKFQRVATSCSMILAKLRAIQLLEGDPDTYWSSETLLIKP